jgi:P-type Cu+ transporter
MDSTEVPSASNLQVEHRLKRRLRVTIPSLAKHPERLYALEILLRKRPAIRSIRAIPRIGGMVIHYEPTELSENALLKALTGIIPNLGSVPKSEQDSGADLVRTETRKEIQFAVEGISCASCALLIELVLRRDPRIEKAAVNMASSSGSVTGFIPQEALFALIEKHGYRALPLDTVSQRKILMDREEDRIRDARNRALVAALLSIPVTIIAMAEPKGWFWRWIQLVLTTPIVLWSGKPFLDKATKLAKQGNANMDSLIVMGVGSAYIYSSGALFMKRPYLYFDAAAGIICFVLLGRYMEEKAKGKAHSAIRRLLDLQPQTANLLRNGEISTVSVDDLVIGDVILIRPGEKIPTDGVVLEGNSTVDESMITGESIPVIKAPSHSIVGGCINGTGSLTVEVRAIGANTVLAGIIHMVDQAQTSKLPIQKTVDRISAIFVPSVVVISGITFGAWLLAGAGFTTAFATGITVLLIACPCALGLATPAAIMVGTGQAAQRGIFIRNGESLETATRINTIIFDKTGTITEGKPYVTDFINISKLSNTELASLVGTAEIQSEHFLGKAIVEHAKLMGAPLTSTEAFEAFPGKGLKATVGGRELTIGNVSWMEELKVKLTTFKGQPEALALEGKTPVICLIDGKPAGLFGIADKARDHAGEAIRRLQAMGVETIMVTGDVEAAAHYVAKQVGIEKVVAQARPDRKLEIVRELQAQGKTVGMIGDGINDAPALAAANVGFAIGTGTDVAIETADLTLVNGDITKVADALEISTETLQVIRQNLAWAFGYNILSIPIAAFGKLNPMVASIAMALSSVSVVLNSLRLQHRTKEDDSSS